MLKSGSATTTFTQADLAANAISFSHDGGELDGSFTVSLTDGSSPSQSATVNATVNPHVNDAPVLTGDFTLPPVRNGFLDYILDSDLFASDPDNTPAQLIYTVINTSHGLVQHDNGIHFQVTHTSFSQARLSTRGMAGPDGALFFRHDASGLDASFTVSLTDGIAPAQIVTVVMPVIRPTDIVAGFPLAVDEDSPPGTLVGYVTGVEPGNPGDFTYSLVDDAGARFQIGPGGKITVGTAPVDFDQSPSQTIVVRVTDIDRASFDKAFTITINDTSPVIVGGGGPDTLTGGAFNDTINGAGGDDVLIGGGGNDYVTSGDGNDKAFGEAGNDTLLGADGNDYLNGGADDDLIVGNGGADTLMGDAGNDYLNGGDGDDLLVGNDGTDTLLGDIGNDYLDGGAGPDTLFGNAGNDTVLGGDGEDYVNGGDGEDVVFGGAGNDTVVGESGNDDINGETGNDVVFGGAGNDTVLGADGDDYLAGDAGDDNLAGGIGNDTLFAGSGSDYLQGDAGDDMFVFEASFGTSLIIDFEIGSAAHHDVVQFKGGVFANLADVLAHAVQDGTNLVITTNTGDTLTLANVLKANLTADHFAFA
ncbi:MAG: cadherin-like domain-containing protein [Microvirga sp.]